MSPTLLFRLAAAAVVFVAGGQALALGTPAAATAIYQQRGADGSIVLTDRPSPTTVIERAWKVDPEDSAAARQRAIDSRNEAQAVTERIRVRIAEQQRRLDDDMLRMQMARAEEDRRRAIDLSSPYPGLETGVIYTPYGVRGSQRYRSHRDDRDGRGDRTYRDGRGGRDTGARAPRFREPATPENR